MGKRVYVGNGSYCYTDNCTRHDRSESGVAAVRAAESGDVSAYLNSREADAKTAVRSGPSVSFHELSRTITDKDIDEGLLQAGYDLQHSRGSVDVSWGKLMGSKTRRTRKNMELYDEKLRSIVRNDPESYDRALKYARNRAWNERFGRAYDQGVKLPKKYEEAFEAHWNSRGKATAEKNLAELEALEQDYRSGRIGPARIVGTGYRNPQMVADQYFERTKRNYSHIIATRGRADTVTASNIHRRATEEGWAE